MGRDSDCRRLAAIYDIYDDFVADYDLACRKECAHCCTCNVTATSLEGLLIVRHLGATAKSPRLPPIEAAGDQPRFQPRTTINALADLCARGEEVPEEAADPNVGACPWLNDETCPIYAVRPFGCRAMVSRTDCGRTGEADMPEFVLTVNNVFLQYIESMDTNGLSGNLIDILLFLSAPEHRRAYEAQEKLNAHNTLLANRPAPVLMVPPEHRQRIQPLLQKVYKAIQLL